MKQYRNTRDMTDEPKADRRDKLTGAPITPALARTLWFSGGKPSMKQFAKILQEQGYHAPRTTLERWCAADKQWALARAQKEQAIPPESIITALHEAVEVSGEMASEVFLGTKAQLVARLYETIKTMPINTIEEWAAGLECCEKIEALIHIERGKAISDGKRDSALRGVSPSLMSRIEPEVTVAPFKRAN